MPGPTAATVLASAASLVLFPRDPRSDSPYARPHGRVDAAATVVRVLVVLAAAFVDSMSPAVFIAIVCVASVAQLYGYLTYLPYYSPVMNQLHVACAGVQVWASLCMVTAQVRGQPEVLLHRQTHLVLFLHCVLIARLLSLLRQDEVEGYLLVFALPLIVVLGVAAAALRFHGMAHSKELSNPYLVRMSIVCVTLGVSE
jgi:hypothetical protein